MNSKNSPFVCVCVCMWVCFTQKKPHPVAAEKGIAHILKSHQKKYEPKSAGKALFLSF